MQLVPLRCGADVDTSVHGSGFPRKWDADHGPGARDDDKNAMVGLCTSVDPN